MDRSYYIKNIPDYLLNGDLIVQSHKYIGRGLKTIHHTINSAGYVYLFSERTDSRHGGFKYTLRAEDGWELMPLTNMGWNGGAFNIWRKEVSQFGSVSFRVSTTWVGGVVLVLECGADSL